jgi:micrococcal nuclease
MILALLLAAAHPCTAPRVIDGDTLACSRERIRLLGIDAPEMPGHCRRGRACVKGDPFASKRSLQAILAGSRPVRIEPVTTDRYGRTVAVVRAGGRNLSCWQLERRAAKYVARWDDGGRIARECRP